MAEKMRIPQKYQISFQLLLDFPNYQAKKQLSSENPLFISRVGEYVCGMALGYPICSLDGKIGTGKKAAAIFTALETLATWIPVIS